MFLLTLFLSLSGTLLFHLWHADNRNVALDLLNLGHKLIDAATIIVDL